MATLTAPTPTIDREELYADGFGNWHAVIRAIAVPLDLTTVRPDMARWNQARDYAAAYARRAIIEELATREQTTGETTGAARTRIRAYLKRCPLKLERIDYNGEAITVVYGENPA